MRISDWSSDVCSSDLSLTATVTVRNAGAVAGEEIVQLYISDPVASRSRPLRELKGFQKNLLQPGEERSVGLGITVADLRFFRSEHLSSPEHVWGPGIFVLPECDIAWCWERWCRDIVYLLA